MKNLLSEIRDCNICASQLPMGPRPIFAVHPKSKIVIIGQAPGAVVHRTGIPWDDKSGENLRKWMGITSEVFYEPKKIALIPMGFCYPGRNKSGDKPPIKECAIKWHSSLLEYIDTPDLILLVGKYAQDYYLRKKAKKNLTETVRNFNDYLPNFFVLPHPSPRNNIWQAKNPWFSEEVLPKLKQRINQVLQE